ncbi:MAG: PepSY domain-containing protein [Candidatus Binatia bacterium]
MKLLHKIIFWLHLISGVIAGVVIFIMSFTGFVLMYEHQLVEYAERDVRVVKPPAGEPQRLSLDELVANAREQNPGAQPTGVVFRSDPAAAVAVSFGRGGTTYVDPYSGAFLGNGSKLHDWFHDVIVWHRWLGQEGEGRAIGKAVTGACNLAFFVLAITGVYLWWPRSWMWRALKPSLWFNTRLRGKARDWNWHNVIGFWSSGVLVVLTLTAAVMSYPWASDLLYTLTGSEPPPRTARQPGSGARGEENRVSKPATSFDDLLARAQKQMPGWATIMIRLPARGDGPVNVSIQETQPPHPFARSQLTLDRATAEVIKWEPYSDNSTGRKLRTWFRGLHTGEAFGFIGQTIAGLASLGGCFLVWTGFAMAWRRFRYRKRDADDTPAVESVTTPAETISAIMQPAAQLNETCKEVSKIAMEESNSTATNGHSHNGREDDRAEWNTAPYNGDSVLVLYGTVTGNAALLANKLAAALRGAGVTAQVRDMAHCQPSVLTQANCVLIVISTYGDGEPPDDAAPFWEAVVHGNCLNLRGVRFSVLALGNTTYDHFCKCGRDFDAALERHGASRIYPRVDCDVDYHMPAKYWVYGVVASLRQRTTPFCP